MGPKSHTEVESFVKRPPTVPERYSVKTRICLLFRLFQTCALRNPLTLEHKAFGKYLFTQQELSNQSSTISLIFYPMGGGAKREGSRWNLICLLLA